MYEIKHGTPVEMYTAGRREVLVKREDLCCPYPGPAFSKTRGIAKYVKKLGAGCGGVGVLSTQISRAGWGTAYVCAGLKIPCWNFHPVLKAPHGLPMDVYNTAVEHNHGINVGLVNSRGSILWQRGRHQMETLAPKGVMLPFHLALQETVEETALEAMHTFKKITPRTIVVPVGSGTICSGVLHAAGSEMDVVGVLVASGVNLTRRKKTILHNAHVSEDGFFKGVHSFTLIPTEYAYLDRAKTNPPFSCDPFYDAKAWEWLAANIASLKPPVLFWNIGGSIKF